MSPKPLAIVNSAIIDNNRILLIKRVKPPYVGYYSMPGGKIEFAEHVEEAAIRELKEETDIDSKFEKLCGIASEVIHEKNKPNAHFIIFVCKLKHIHTNIVESEEGKLKWVALDNIENEKIVPSDKLMLKEFILKDKKLDIHRIRVKQDGEEYFVEEFGT